MELYQTTLKDNFVQDTDDGRRILVVEDDDVSYTLLDEILSIFDLNSTRAINGREAINFFKSDKNAFDLVLMDIRMPKVNGFDATRQIKEINPTVPVVAITAYTHPQGVVDCFNCGCDNYIAKPFDISNLISTVKTYISIEK